MSTPENEAGERGAALVQSAAGWVESVLGNMIELLGPKASWVVGVANDR